MNLQITPPLDEISAAPSAADEVARILSDARITDGAALLDCLEARRNELGLSSRTCELAVGLTDGHWTKVCGPARERSPTLRTLDRMLEALGLLVGALAFGISLSRDRLYGEDLSDLQYVAAMVNDGAPG